MRVTIIKNFVCLSDTLVGCRTPRQGHPVTSYTQLHLVKIESLLLSNLSNLYTGEISAKSLRIVLELCDGNQDMCVFASRQRTHHFDPVSIGVQDEREEIQLSFGQALLKRHAEPLEACAGGLDVGHGDRDVAETARLGVARVVLHLGFVLRAVVVGELEDA